MCAKHYENPTMFSKVTAKNVGDVFFETHCILSYLISVPFFFSSSIVRLGLGLVVGLGIVLVLLFIAFFLSDVC